MTCNLQQQIINTYYSDYKFFFSKPNVEGIGFGYKSIKGIFTSEPSIIVFVDTKVAENLLPSNGVIPKLYKGIKTDVIETGPFSTNSNDCLNLDSNAPPVFVERIRPIQAGYCISPSIPSGTGTFGYIATDDEQVSKTYCLLSTATCLAERCYAPIGTEIIQPSRGYGGSAPNDVVGKLLKFIPIKLSNFVPNELKDFNLIDGGVASYLNVGEVQLLNPIIPGIGIISGISSPQVLQSIQWTGCISGNGKGTILSINTLLKLRYHPFRDAYFKDITISGGPKCFPGDFGAIVCNLNENALGMIFANTPKVNVYNASCTMENIQNELKISLLHLK